MGWHRAREAARSFDVWVICEEHEFAAAIGRYLESHGPIPGLEFAFVAKLPWERRLERVPGFYQAIYRRWHGRAFDVAKRLHAQFQFDLVHQANMIGFREPGLLWKLDAPFLWGPIGGTQNYPWRFLGEAGVRGGAVEAVRNVLNWLQLRLSLRVRRAARKAAAVVASNSTVARHLARALGVRPLLLADTGVEGLRPIARTEPRPPGELRLLWSGEFTPRKALSLLIKALTRLPPGVRCSLRVLGDGPMRARWQRLARRQGVEGQMEFLGWLPRSEALRHYEWADVFVFTSLRDTTGTVVLEALGSGLPVVCLDHQGVGDAVTEECGIKIPVSTPAKVVAGIGEAVARLALDPQLRRRLSDGAVARAEEYLWSRNGARMTEIYRQVLDRREGAARAAGDESLLRDHGSRLDR